MNGDDEANAKLRDDWHRLKGEVQRLETEVSQLRREAVERRLMRRECAEKRRELEGMIDGSDASANHKAYMRQCLAHFWTRVDAATAEVV